MESCEEPKCNFSKRYDKCIKPNPYIETIAKCGRDKIKRKDCIYDKTKTITTICNYYNERIGKKIKPPSSEKKKEKSLSSSTKRKLEIIKKKIMARKIVKKFILPFTNRVSSNINSRIEYANKLKEEIKEIAYNKCLEYINDGKYKIGNNIILEKRIGSDSAYGIIYYSKLKLYKFAAKIMSLVYYNTREIEIANNLSKLVLKRENPHFPIIYKHFTCFNPINNSNYPILTRDDKYLILLNELANGDLETLIALDYINNDLFINIIQQIYISILSFHKKSRYAHCDAHSGNFLYHKIKPGGYFHYYIKDIKKNFYIENKGYLWIIWDYGNSQEINPNEKKMIFDDYRRIHCYFRNRKYNKDKNADDIIIKLKQILEKLYTEAENENELWKQLKEHLFSKYIPKKNEIINSKPFYL